jgi:hypothetical protein
MAFTGRGEVTNRLIVNCSYLVNRTRQDFIRSRPGLDYTILRPGGLSDNTRDDYQGEVALQLEACSERLINGGTPPLRSPVVAPGRIGRADLAALAVASLDHPHASRRILACRWVGASLTPVAQGTTDDGSSNWTTELNLLGATPPSLIDAAAPIKARPYAVAVAAAPPLIFLFANIGAFGLQKLIKAVVVR